MMSRVSRAFLVEPAYNARAMVSCLPFDRRHAVPHRVTSSPVRHTLGGQALVWALVVCVVGCDAGDTPRSAASDEAAAPTTADDPVMARAAFEELRNVAFSLFDRHGSTPEVLAALARAHALDGQAWGVNNRMARVSMDLKRHADALRHHELNLALRPEDLATRREVASLSVSLGRDERALEVVEPLLADPQWIGDGTSLKAMALDNLGRRAEALDLLESVGDLPLDQAASCLGLHGRMLHEQGDHARAHERFTAAVALAPDDQAVVKGLADTCRRLGRDDEADRWDEVLELFLALTDNRFTRAASPKRDRKGQRQAGRHSEYIGREQAAQVERLRRMIELHPRWAVAWEQLAELLRRDGDRDGACRSIQDLMARHGVLYDEARRAELLRKFCAEGG